MVDRDPVDRSGRSVARRCSATPPTRCTRSARTGRRRRSSTPGCSPAVSAATPTTSTRPLARYEAARRPATAAIVQANRGLGPELPMQLVRRARARRLRRHRRRDHAGRDRRGDRGLPPHGRLRPRRAPAWRLPVGRALPHGLTASQRCSTTRAAADRPTRPSVSKRSAALKPAPTGCTTLSQRMPIHGPTGSRERCSVCSALRNDQSAMASWRWTAAWRVVGGDDGELDAADLGALDDGYGEAIQAWIRRSPSTRVGARRSGWCCRSCPSPRPRRRPGWARRAAGASAGSNGLGWSRASRGGRARPADGDRPGRGHLAAVAGEHGVLPLHPPTPAGLAAVEANGAMGTAVRRLDRSKRAGVMPGGRQPAGEEGADGGAVDEPLSHGPTAAAWARTSGPLGRKGRSRDRWPLLGQQTELAFHVSGSATAA